MRTTSVLQFEMDIADALKQAGFKFARDTSFGGVQADFGLVTPDGRAIVVEAKAWTPTPQNRRRAIEQARFYKAVTGADRVFVVLQGLKRGRPRDGLVSQKELIDALSLEFKERKMGGIKAAPFVGPRGRRGMGQVPGRRRAQGRRLRMGPLVFEMQEGETKGIGTTYTVVPRPRTGKKGALRRVRAPRRVFAAMPFSPEYDDAYFVAMVPAAESVRAVCSRVDQEEFEGDVVERIESDIRDSDAVIADLSEAKPNVLYETGFAHALGRPTIHISSTSLNDLPFDVRN